MKNIFFTTAVALFMITIFACKEDPRAAYMKLEKNALATGQRSDSLFLGFYLGMPTKEFYDLCWKLNKTAVIKEGAGNMTAQYVLDTTHMRFITNMDFYPKFADGKIYRMPIVFQYKIWNPIMKETTPDNLQLDVLKLFEKWYGKGFIKVIDPVKGRVFVKMDGNRRISISKNALFDVDVNIVDLPAAKILEKKGAWKDEF